MRNLVVYHKERDSGLVLKTNYDAFEEGKEFGIWAYFRRRLSMSVGYPDYSEFPVEDKKNKPNINSITLEHGIYLDKKDFEKIERWVQAVRRNLDKNKRKKK